MREDDVTYLRLSRSVFPFEKEIVVGYANFFISKGIITLEAMNEIKYALKYDPYSVRLLGVYCQYLDTFGNRNEALKIFNKMELIFPKSKMTEIVSARFKEQRKD